MESKLARSLSLAGGAGAAPLKGTIELAELAFGDEIGHGAFSRVYRGGLRGGVVAIKKITVPRRDLDRHLAGELALLSSPSMLHANLIRYHGVAIEPVAGGAGQIIHIVTEYMGGGDLRSVLKRRDVPLAWALRVRLARDVAAAVAHLHENELIHRDIKTENILLDDDWRCVLADYGFARKMAGPAGSAQAMTLCGPDEFMVRARLA
jgi:serine/threonine protein kinase